MIFNHGLPPFKQVFAIGQVGSVKITPEPKFESGPDTTAPLILIPGNIVVDATSKDGAVVDYSAKAIDDVDEVVSVTCTPKSGTMFAMGERTVVCSSIDSSSNEGVNTFIVSVQTINAVPDWVKEVALFYSNDEIEYASFTNALEYLINNEIIRIDTSEIPEPDPNQQMSPATIKGIAGYWAQDAIDEETFLTAIKWLIDNGIIILI